MVRTRDWKLLLLIFLVIALVFALILVGQRQIIQKRATSLTADFSLAPNSAPSGTSVNSSLPIHIWIHTPSTTQDPIKLVSMNVIVNFDKNKLQVDSAITSSVTGFTSPPIFVTTQSDANSSGKIELRLGIPGGGIANAPSDPAIDLAIIPFKVIANGSSQVTFDTTNMVVNKLVGTSGLEAMTITATPGTYTVGGGATPTPTVTGTPNATPTPTSTPGPTVTPTPTTQPRPTDAPTITHLSNFCGKPLETSLIIYGTNFGTSKGSVTFLYKSPDKSLDADATYTTANVSSENILLWTNTIVVVKIPEVTYGKDSKGGDNIAVIAKIKVIKPGFEDWPFIFPGDPAFLTISKSQARNIADLNCDGAVNEYDFAVLFNNYK